jgi:hypothetical protein
MVTPVDEVTVTFMIELPSLILVSASDAHSRYEGQAKETGRTETDDARIMIICII